MTGLSQPNFSRTKPCETWISVDDVPAVEGHEVAAAVVVKLRNGHKLQGRMASDVPLPSNVLMYPTRPPNGPVD